MGPLHVIVVDDDAVDRMAIRRRLQDLSGKVVVHEATNARSCFAALELVRGQRRMLLLDVRLANGDDGLAILDRLRADPHHGGDVVFVLSGSSDQAHVDRAYGHLAAGYLTKDVSGSYLDDLYALVGLYARAMAMPA
jgi:CheY-like chemotaxis protein